jgi:eukaryotic-like serine/threonine-protein kinase
MIAAPSIGRYLVMREIGRGAMGVVVRAYDPDLARSVAVKIVRPRAHVREAQAMARLTHPNVVAVYDVLAIRDAVCIAMELVDGTTLRGYLRSPRPWRDVLATCVRAGRGLAAAHAAQLIHRDFKPENVLVSGDGRVLVSDFGLARHADDTDDVPLAGSPAYVAPEIYRGGPASATSDQFAFCVTAWEALYGERPFAGATRAEVCANILAGRVRRPSDTRVPAHVRAALLRGLAREPRDRFPSMSELLAALERDPVRRTVRVLAITAALLAAALVGAAVARAPNLQQIRADLR